MDLDGHARCASIWHGLVVEISPEASSLIPWEEYQDDVAPMWIITSNSVFFRVREELSLTRPGISMVVRIVDNPWAPEVACIVRIDLCVPM